MSLLKRNKKNKGFTLVELVVVILIIAILATATFLGGATVIRQSRKSKVQTNLNNYATYVQDMMYSEPEIVGKTESEVKTLLNTKYLTEDFQIGEIKDSWNASYEFYFVTDTIDTHKCTYVIISSNGSNGSKESYDLLNGLIAHDHLSAQAALDSGTLMTGDDLGTVVLLRDGDVSSANYGFDKVSAAPTAITMLDGVNQVYDNTDEPLVFRSSAPMSTFMEVKVDNETVAPANYTVTEGSTIITFTDSYVQTLAKGNHSVEIVSTGGVATTDFTVELAYVVTFDANGGNVETATKDINYNTAYGTLPVPTYTGYMFDGWYTAATGGNKVETNTTVAITAAQTLYAHWHVDKPVASLTAKSGTTYTNGISTLSADKMSTYGELISNNSTITNTTSVVYIDDGDSHYKISIGDNIYLTVSGASYEFVIIGFNHDDLTDLAAYGTATATGKAGMTLQMRNCLTTTYKINPSDYSSGGWKSCSLRNTLQSTIKASMNDEWKSVIKTVKKLAASGSGSYSLVNSDDTLFLLSEIEVFGNVKWSASGEGTQYSWYAAGNTKGKTVNGIDSTWFERSPQTYYDDWCAVYKDNNSWVQANTGVTNSFGIAFAFCV